MNCLQDGKISAEEFKDAVNRTCVGKKYDQFPEPFKAFVESSFNLLDINSDGIVGLEEYRYNCISRIAIDDVGPIDKAFESLLNVSIKYMKRFYTVINVSCIF